MDCDCQQVVDLELRFEMPEVLRVMGCGKAAPVRPEHRSLVERLITQARPQLFGRGVYVIRPVAQMTEHELLLEGCRPIRGPVASHLKPARRVATFITTIGDGCECLGGQRTPDRTRLEGYIMSAIAAAAADAAVDAMADAIYFRHARPDEALTPPFSPGCCGLSVEERLSLFASVDAGAIGVKLLPTMDMQPERSVAGLIGIGDSKDVEAHGLPCQYCNEVSCHLRRW